MATVTSHIGYALSHYCGEIEKSFGATVLAYVGSIHGRMIGIKKVQDMLRLEIEDYTNDQPLRFCLRSYGDLLTEFVTQQRTPCFIHHAKKVIS